MPPAKTQRIDLRATPRQEALIQQAAAQTDRTVSEFILSSATMEAERVTTSRRWFTVDDPTFEQVMQVLDAPLTDTWGLPLLCGHEGLVYAACSSVVAGVAGVWWFS
ncbi:MULTISPECIES: DUF1778 domain-containing protein [unclassified Actinomyces]|uniref:type II toxin-antitoxin system TacA family antitoxin n=1 Tax=unclassified Actinomyces TaxID=2609248 RepID=UPI000D598570|nr:MULTISPECIES: DUF1778 domain-containing protein [unclassified Actinomyces]RAX24126.1 DUF1778 domain-containing protein [Actinomyces sp. Z3]